MPFKLTSIYSPTGDQPQAIHQLVKGLQAGDRAQVLLGVTGSGKTFTMANVIAQADRPTLVLTHNKTLTAQLYGEFQNFFPDNAVEYFVSPYDYFQPEAVSTENGIYIGKQQQANESLDELRLKATATLLSGRRDIIIVASVSCIYGMGNPDDYKSEIIRLSKGQTFPKMHLLFCLVDSLYKRSDTDFDRGTFRVNDNMVEINPPYANWGYRVVFSGDEIESIGTIEKESGQQIEAIEKADIFPANLYISPRERITQIMAEIQAELIEQERYFIRDGRLAEARRIRERTSFDLEMIKELGYCNGIENYSRYFDGRRPGVRPFCLLDYFPDDYLMIVDESHVTLPQVRGMSGGDRVRKQSLVNEGFRLPSALDNRPLQFEEFEAAINQVIFVSATPGDYELEETAGVVVEQLVRPTGLLDPPIVVRPLVNQMDDLIEEIRQRMTAGERTLVTTQTKRMAEELAGYMAHIGIRCRYIHSEVETLERVEILRDLRLGEYDVIIGVNLLREGLDLPEVSFVAVLDADKEGFLRNTRALIQTAGRAARNANGLVVFYANKVTKSMQYAMNETNRRRSVQIAYNEAHGITPRTVTKTKDQVREQRSVLDVRGTADWI